MFAIIEIILSRGKASFIILHLPKLYRTMKTSTNKEETEEFYSEIVNAIFKACKKNHSILVDTALTEGFLLSYMTI